MKKPLIIMLGLALSGVGVALAQETYTRTYTFEEVDTNGDGKISIEEAKVNPGFIDEAIYRMWHAAKPKGTSDTWDVPITKEDWDGLTSH